MRGFEVISALAELDRLGWRYQPASDSQVKLACPVHADESPSASMNTTTCAWRCHVPSCGVSGDIVAFIAYATKVDRNTVLADLRQRYPALKQVAEIPLQTIEKFHQKIWDSGPLLGALRARGITDAMIRAARLGYHDGRITIPVFDTDGLRCLNVRRYLPGAPGPQKMRNTTGYGGPHLYGAHTLADMEKVWICGGEMKALVVHSMLNGEVAAVASTGGEGHWRQDWSAMLKGRDVWICMDIDEHGLVAARKIASQVVRWARSCYIVRLPLDAEKFPKGDVNDWVGACGATADDLRKIMTTAQSCNDVAVPTRGEPSVVEFEHALSHGVGQAIEVTCVIAALDQTPFLVPNEIDVECTRDQPGCVRCPIQLEVPNPETGLVRCSVASSAPAILGMAGAPEKEQRVRISEALGIPKCKTVQFHVRSHYVAHDVRVAPPIDVSRSKGGDAWHPAMIVRASPELNVPCKMRGSVYPHPKTQQATLLIDELEELEDTVSSFAPAEHELDELRIFQPTAWSVESLDERLTHIWSDIEANVTRIFKRRELHAALDVAWHAPLLFTFDGRTVNGWTNVLVIGDSSQGKSECALRLLEHYGCGDRLDCKNATVAGLLGGLEQLGTRWFVRWGAIPQHDRGLVVLEELKGAPVEVLSKLTDMRSSGIAEIPKIERRRALARTRILMLSNPRSPRPMSSFHHGIEAVLELLGSLEDVRRLDLAVALSRDDIGDEVTNMSAADRPVVAHTCTAELCKRLVMWAWSRLQHQVEFLPQAQTAVFDASRKLCGKYVEAIPLVDKGTMRHKIAKVAAAIAARTFSTDDGTTLLVRPAHVQWSEQFIDACYSSSAMGYAQFSARHAAQTTIQDPIAVRKKILSTRNPADLVSVLLSRDTVSLEDVQAACGIDYEGSRAVLSLFVRKGALLRVTRTEYAKNPQFIAMLKQMSTETLTQDVEGDEF